MNTIQPKSDLFIEALERVTVYDAIQKTAQDNDVEFVLYGASACAEYIFDKIGEFGIVPDHVVIDSEFINPKSKMTLRGEAIQSIQSLKGKSNLCWFIGFYNDNLIETVNSKMQKVSEIGVDVSEVFVLDYALIVRPWRMYSYDFVKKHVHELQETYASLKDDLSRKTMIAFLNQRITGRIGPIDAVKVGNQYFTDFVELSQHEIFVDCGAYNGDSIQAFIQALQQRGRNSYGAIFAFEPDPNRRVELDKNCREIKNINIVPKGAWSSNTTLKFSINDELSSEIDESGEESVDVTTIDSVAGDAGVTFIKMDIQGAELEALKGAEQTIRNYHPTLAICAYHEHRDLIDLPRIIRKFNPKYQLYLRAHRSKSNELVLYAIHKD